MNSTEKVILIESLNKSSKNENMSLNTALSGNKKLLPEDGIDSIINIYDEYVKERTNSNKFRLIIDISPFCIISYFYFYLHFVVIALLFLNLT